MKIVSKPVPPSITSAPPVNAIGPTCPIKLVPETAANLIQTDPHSPAQYRTIGAPVNMDAWYQAFGVKPGDKLYKKPEDRIKIW
jgi:hypothetical protein